MHPARVEPSIMLLFVLRYARDLQSELFMLGLEQLIHAYAALQAYKRTIFMYLHQHTYMGVFFLW